MSSKSFETIWREYVIFCKKEQRQVFDDPSEAIELQYELEECKNDFMHFFDFLRLREEIYNGVG
jgi:hypothetical protein